MRGSNSRQALLMAACLLAGSGFGSARAAADEVPLPVGQWRVVKRESGPVNYYTVVSDSKPPYIRGHYRPGLKTAVLGFPLAEGDRQKATRLRWRWRAQTLPTGGNECQPGKRDSAAAVYVTWRRMLRWYTLKYVWSSVGPKGAVCAQKRNALQAQDSILLQSGGPLNEWKTEEIDLKSEFRKHFEGGNPKASVPDLLGVGLLTDGDGTNSHSMADYADFVIIR